MEEASVMVLYLVAPELSVVRELVAKPGWRVHITPLSALHDLDERYSRARKSCQMRPTMLYADIDHRREILVFDKLEPNEPRLIESVKGWKRFTQEDYKGWQMEARFGGLEPKKRFNHVKEWSRYFPPSASLVEPGMMEHRNAVHPSDPVARRAAQGARGKQ